MKLNHIRKHFSSITIIIGIIIIAYGWLTVYETISSLKQTVYNSYQNEQLNIIKLLTLEIENHNFKDNFEYKKNSNDIKFISKFIIKNISGLNYGRNNDKLKDYCDIWFIPYNEKSTEVIIPNQNFKVNITDYFNLSSKKSSAKHIDKLLTSLRKKEEYTGWFINSKDKSYSDRYIFRWEYLYGNTGMTIVAFTPFYFEGRKWILGISTLFPKLLQSSGTYTYINKAVLQMLAVSIFIIILLITVHIFRLKVFRLNNQISCLKIEIDRIDQEQQISDIIDSSYFNKIKEIVNKK